MDCNRISPVNRKENQVSQHDESECDNQQVRYPQDVYESAHRTEFMEVNYLFLFLEFRVKILFWIETIKDIDIACLRSIRLL